MQSVHNLIIKILSKLSSSMKLIISKLSKKCNQWNPQQCGLQSLYASFFFIISFNIVFIYLIYRITWNLKPSNKIIENKQILIVTCFCCCCFHGEEGGVVNITFNIGDHLATMHDCKGAFTLMRHDLQRFYTTRTINVGKSTLEKKCFLSCCVSLNIP